MFVRYLVSLVAITTIAVSCSSNSTRETMQSIQRGEHRSVENQVRDRYRHPAETLDFFAVEPQMTVVEIAPGAGWYTEILAPYLHEEGQLYAAHFAADSPVPYFKKSRTAFLDKLAAHPEVYSKIIVTELAAPEKLEIAPPRSVDRVLTFRNVHNWMKAGQAQTVFKAMYAALKPGGILGVVEHRANSNSPFDESALSGYVAEQTVIEFAERAGFKLVAKSEINSNLKDTADHPAGVWTLPPSLRLKDQDRKKYLSIGESDRMTLKFSKP